MTESLFSHKRIKEGSGRSSVAGGQRAVGIPLFSPKTKMVGISASTPNKEETNTCILAFAYSFRALWPVASIQQNPDEEKNLPEFSKVHFPLIY
jgi:hypothetical protein